MSYHLVFDVDQAGYTAWTLPAASFVGVLAGVLVAGYPDRAGRRLPPHLRRPVTYAFLGIAVFYTLGSLATTLKDYWRLRSDLDEGRCAVVEGTVTDFVPARARHNESFRVGGQFFSYSDARVTAGFHQTSKSGGPMQAGLRVRISHRSGEIARLEIAD
jgi:hypothetical protein